MVDESLEHPDMIEQIALEEIADAPNVHASKFGCLIITHEAVLNAQNLGSKVQIGSSLMTEIGLARFLHLATSIPRLDYSLEEVGLTSLYLNYSTLRDLLDRFLM